MYVDTLINNWQYYIIVEVNIFIFLISDKFVVYITCYCSVCRKTWRRLMLKYQIPFENIRENISFCPMLLKNSSHIRRHQSFYFFDVFFSISFPIDRFGSMEFLYTSHCTELSTNNLLFSGSSFLGNLSRILSQNERTRTTI